MFLQSRQYNYFYIYLYLFLILHTVFYKPVKNLFRKLWKRKDKVQDQSQIINHLGIQRGDHSNILTRLYICLTIYHFLYILYSSQIIISSQYLHITFSQLMMSSKYQQEEEFRLHEPNVKAKYSKTSMKKKKQLIDFVVNQNYSIYKASKKLKLSNSTAKSIINNYEKYGTLLQKFTKNRILNLKNDQSQTCNKIQNKNIIKEQNLSQEIIVKQEQNPIIDNINEANQYYYPFYTYSYPLMFANQQP